MGFDMFSNAQNIARLVPTFAFGGDSRKSYRYHYHSRNILKRGARSSQLAARSATLRPLLNSDVEPPCCSPGQKTLLA